MTVQETINEMLALSQRQTELLAELLEASQPPSEDEVQEVLDEWTSKDLKHYKGKPMLLESYERLYEERPHLRRLYRLVWQLRAAKVPYDEMAQFTQRFAKPGVSYSALAATASGVVRWHEQTQSHVPPVRERRAELVADCLEQLAGLVGASAEVEESGEEVEQAESV